MMENTPHNHRLDDYLLGKLSADEHAEMESQLAADSQLREDMFLQRDIVQALQENRRLELKNRLNSIEVGTGGFSTAIGLKIAAGVALMGLMGTGIYWFLNSSPATPADALPTRFIELNEGLRQVDYTLPQMPEVHLAQAEPSEEVPAAEAATAAASLSGATTTAAAKPAVPTPGVAKKKSSAPAETPARAEAVVQKPNVLSEFKDTDLGTISNQGEAPVDALSRNRQFTNRSIEVSTQTHEKYDFHYRFYDSKLFIYGNFDSKPYEILEINTEGTRSYFLYFEDNYYALNTDQQKLTRLRRLSNDKLIKELEITRTQK